MSRANIDSAIIQAWVSANFGLPYRYADLPLLDPNSGETLADPGGLPWARLTIVHARPDIATQGPNGKDEIVGIFQVDLFYRLGSGPGAANAKADELSAVFGAGKTHSFGGVNVHFDYCGKIRQVVTEDWFQTIVEAGFHTWIGR